VIGGSPIQPANIYPGAYTYQPAPQQRPRSAGNPARTTPSANAGRVRLQSADEAAPALSELPRPSPIEMPTPEKLGLGPKRADVDWSAVRRRLDALSVATFHLQKRAEGGFRFTCVVDNAGQRRKFEAEGENEAEAIDQTLRLAEGAK
jgi:hypothetical protein